MAFPDFTSATTFPAFESCPLFEEPASDPNENYFLLGTIMENMTLTPITPTFICKDRNGASFAVTLKLRGSQENMFHSGSPKGKNSFGKGKTVVVKNARRKGSRKEDASLGQKEKKGFVEIGWEVEGSEGVQIIPTKLEKLIEMSENRKSTFAGTKTCQGCRKVEKEGGEKMVRCKGCENVWYCGKDCQVKGWSGGHKSECKILRSANDAFGDL
ncbi:hypothetical protein BJ875DRAFT_461334 [Amylocarpus encephaloides]|uniref:MYND-type domain-containing protein n=1 Tax=Amylocarpus encephaloides TaxID=45428 RepID=A0A9P7YJ91_9HELO|nr:hypothetical protein BJ875DRAFT_461334 [Amylocarpus encephaloides]